MSKKKEQAQREIALAYWKNYTRTYRQNNPEKALRWRINSAIKLLEQNGYSVEKLQDPPSSEKQQ